MTKTTTPARPLSLPRGRAICYSGYREGQSPRDGVYPSRAQILEDLLILQPHFRLLRLYDASLHAERVLQVIREEDLDFKVLLGAELAAEVNNPGCPWGAQYADEVLAAHRAANEAQVDRAAALARAHPDTVFAVAVGNECTVDWTDHLVPVERMIELVRRMRVQVNVPITFCENYVPWLGKLAPLVPELDFLCVHSYPVWEFKLVQDAMAYTLENVHAVMHANPGKPVIVSEAGWTTGSNGRGIPPHHVSQELQAEYVGQLLRWSDETETPCFVFEAFDEPWKGSDDPMEPEKHWGLYTVDRRPKRFVMHGGLELVEA
jgi:exo-beta-1,3-glucanase (GH17 family)